MPRLSLLPAPILDASESLMEGVVDNLSSTKDDSKFERFGSEVDRLDGDLGGMRAKELGDGKVGK